MLRFIYILCLWHGLAKRRQHTDASLKLLEATTERLGDELRAFETYTATFDAYETPPRKQQHEIAELLESHRRAKWDREAMRPAGVVARNASAFELSKCTCSDTTYPPFVALEPPIPILPKWRVTPLRRISLCCVDDSDRLAQSGRA